MNVISTIWKGIGNTFLKGHERILKISHDDAGWFELGPGEKRAYVLVSAITANVTTTTAPAGSLGMTSNATGKSSIFVSDGTKWQAFLGITPLVAGTHVAALTVTGQKAGYVYYQNVPTATTTAGATQLSLNGVSPGATMVSPISPKIPRNIVYTITDGNSGISAFSITAVGIGVDGSAVTETITQAGGLVQTGSKIFATLTSVTVNSCVGSGAGDTLDIGYGVKIGVPLPAGATSFSVVKLVSAGSAEAASATDTTNNSLTFTTAPDGAKDFEIWYEYLDPNDVAIIAAVNAILSSLEGNAVLAAS